jgi:hypothetical protein
MARIAVRVSGGSVSQTSITWARSGSSEAYSSPTAAHSAALPKTGSRNVLPTMWLRESARFPSTPTSGFRTLVHPPATPCTTGGCFIWGKSVCDPVRGKTAGCCSAFRSDSWATRESHFWISQIRVILSFPLVQREGGQVRERISSGSPWRATRNWSLFGDLDRCRRRC